MLVAWFGFLTDRWLLPQGSLGLEIWLTAVGAIYAAVAGLALGGKRLGATLMPWATILMMVWGLVALMGLSADDISSRSWMWSSLFAAVTGAVTYLLCCLPLGRKPTLGMLVFLGGCAFLGLGAWFQMSRCRIDIHATWCDPRYEQEDRIVATLASATPETSRGHLNGVQGPAYATFLFDGPPDLETAVVPRSAAAVRTDRPDELLWEFGGRDAMCEGRSVLDAAADSYELRFTVDCRR